MEKQLDPASGIIYRKYDMVGRYSLRTSFFTL